MNAFEQAHVEPVAIVAGASSGIGRAIAEALVARGWHVAVLGRRLERLQQLAAAHPGKMHAFACDLTVPEQVEHCARTIAAWRPSVQALVTSAGDFFVRSIESTTPPEFERLWRVNVFSKFLLVRSLLPLLQAAAGAGVPAAILHIASLAVYQDFADESAYGSAMHAIIGLARSQDVELQPRGIRVATLSPGLVRTELTERSFPEEVLATAMRPQEMAATACHMIEVIRQGGYIPELLHKR